MAIKPTDIILYINDERYLADSVDWYGEPIKEVRDPVYWENFKQYAFSLVDEKYKMDWKRYYAMQQQMLKSELAKYNIEFKESKTKKGAYLKFKSEADITFFKLRWA